MAHQINRLAELQAALRHTLNCEVVHRQTTPVHETMGGATIWKGDVEVFDLSGHEQAETCFAWLHHEIGKNPRFVAVLEKGFTNTAEKAVKSAIFFDLQATPL
jgi:hypothetical protein